MADAETTECHKTDKGNDGEGHDLKHNLPEHEGTHGRASTNKCNLTMVTPDEGSDSHLALDRGGNLDEIDISRDRTTYA